MSYDRGRDYDGGSRDSFISCSQLQIHRYIYDFVPSRKMKELIFLMIIQINLLLPLIFHRSIRKAVRCGESMHVENNENIILLSRKDRLY
ncbi:MAG: hypothetical protein M3P08_19090 [Thermoproteota archaeon]|nr:hypothetical protein [Thermoproteota archaeon]